MIDVETPDRGCRNLRWAIALFDGLVGGGLRHVVLSPGSRSTPLVLAARRQPQLVLTPILDERSAAFFALGVARSSAHPVALVCTSGSALAHWFPAVIEASESGLPLILLSADRPPELRGWGANQTVDQTRLFGGFVREFHDPGPAEEGTTALKAMRALGMRAALVTQGSRPGPVHINLPFREPLVPGSGCEPERDSESGSSAGDKTRLSSGAQTPGGVSAASFSDRPVSAAALAPDLGILLKGRGVICCGPMMISDSSAAAIRRCSEILSAPVLADPLAGLRFGPATAYRITRYDSLLRNAELAAELKPDWVLRFGRTPVSKTLMGWLNGVPAVLVDPSDQWSDSNHDVWMRISVGPVGFCEWLQESGIGDSARRIPEAMWAGRWAAAEQRLDRLAEAFLEQAPWFEGHLIRQLLDRLPDGDGLFCANSLPIRQIDTWSGQSAKRLQFFGHRGASGIDGQASTLAGLSFGRTDSAQGVTGLLGDLSFLHDLSGLMLMDGLDRPCIVLNNGGGRIFDYLPQRGLADFERLWRTPPRVEVGALARAFGIRHRPVDDRSGFHQALDDALDAAARGEPAGLIEVRLDADVSLQTHRRFWSSVREQSIIEKE
jgi:2-succinyl-5-enolpyruvyl-6-hydroxy-3-cyclohexene-1-carboxylate synthase